MIADAINTIASKTCIRIRPATRYDDYAVFITNQHNGCFSEVGFVKKSTQLMNLHPEDCNNPSVYIHEFLHVLGFTHEQSASDRDKYVKINFENISEKMRKNFQINQMDTNLGVGYDYNSIMHYRATAFSTNGRPTIVSLTSEQVPPEKPRKLTKKDVLRMNRLYKCKRFLH